MFRVYFYFYFIFFLFIFPELSSHAASISIKRIMCFVWFWYSIPTIVNREFCCSRCWFRFKFYITYLLPFQIYCYPIARNCGFLIMVQKSIFRHFLFLLFHFIFLLLFPSNQSHYNYRFGYTLWHWLFFIFIVVLVKITSIWKVLKNTKKLNKIFGFHIVAR